MRSSDILSLSKKFAAEIEDSPPESWPELKQQGIKNPWEDTELNNARVLRGTVELFPKQLARFVELFTDSEQFKLFSSEEKRYIRTNFGKIYSDLGGLNDYAAQLLHEDTETDFDE